MGSRDEDITYTIENNKIRKAIFINTTKVLFQVECDDNYLIVTLLSNKSSEDIKQKIEAYVVDWLDLKTDITPFYKLLSKTSKLKHMTSDLYGLRIIGFPNLYEVLCWCVIGQVINLNVAYKIKKNIVEKYGETYCFQGKTYYIFPRPEVISNLTVHALMSLQLSKTKANCLIELSNHFKNKIITKEKIFNLPTLQHKQKVLLNIKGIGIWTVNYALLKCFREKNCIPYGDAVLMKKLIAYRIIHDKKDINNLNKFYRLYTDWQHYLTFYLWNT